MAQTIEELAVDRRNWIETTRKNGFEKGIKRFLTELYPDNAHFIYELLQNAEDAGAEEAQFILHEDYLEFEHDGKRLFSLKDIESITGIGSSSKRDDTTKIGKFGIGFKAVFAYTDLPEIKSGTFHFSIHEMVVPKSIGNSENKSYEKTLFTLPFNNPQKKAYHACIEIENLLRSLDATALLFLVNIRKIEYLLPDSSLGYIERVEHPNGYLEIRVQHPNTSTTSSSWFLKFHKDVQIEDDEADDEELRLKNCRIALAFGLKKTQANTGGKTKEVGGKPKWELSAMEPGCVCIYFPANKETSNLHFHLHAPFASTVARDSVRDYAGNNVLRDHLAELLAESMSAIRDQGLLTVKALAILPNDKDYLPSFYQPIIKRLIQVFQKEDLVPMKRGGHAPATRIFRGSRELSELINDDDMVQLLGSEYIAPVWAVNPSQRNQREDNFMSMIGVNQWNVVELAKALKNINGEILVGWMSKKDDQWHQNLYEMLMEYLDKALKSSYNEAEDRKRAIKQINLIRCSDGIHRRGDECFFPTNEIEKDNKFPRVLKNVYMIGENINENARKFLVQIGVKEVDEKLEIEDLLKSQYSQEAVNKEEFEPEISHIKRFTEFLDKHPNCAEIFQKCYILKVENGEWGCPDCVYLDASFMNTGLKAWYETFVNTEYALSSEYEDCGIEPKKIGKFAEQLKVITSLLSKIEKTEVFPNHPDWNYLQSQNRGKRIRMKTNENYHIPDLKDFLESPSIDKSTLVWRTMKKLSYNEEYKYLKARYGTNARNIESVKSTLVYDLIAAKWVPQKTVGDEIEFVSPRDATTENLPDGFKVPDTFRNETEWRWLQYLQFGEGIKARQEAQRLEQEKQTEEYKHKEEFAKKMGFESAAEAEEMARMKKEDPEAFERWKKRDSAPKNSPTFPIRPVVNPERRQERFHKQYADSYKKEYEDRPRSVRITSGAIDPVAQLRNQYTNEADQMICQICKEEMPFRNRNGEPYFEKSEVLSRDYLPKEHEAQYLALCPLCAAKYNEFVKNDNRQIR